MFRLFCCATEEKQPLLGSTTQPFLVPFLFQEGRLTIATLPSKFTANNPPKRILVINPDELLIDLSKSYESESLVLTDAEKITPLLEDAEKNNVMVVMMTSRNYDEERKRKNTLPYILISNALDKIGRHYFSAVFFTNEADNNPGEMEHANLVLNYLHEQHYPNGDKKNICFVGYDTSKSKRLGFSTIEIDKNHFKKMKHFIHQSTHQHHSSISHVKRR